MIRKPNWIIKENIKDFLSIKELYNLNWLLKYWSFLAIISYINNRHLRTLRLWVIFFRFKIRFKFFKKYIKLKFKRYYWRYTFLKRSTKYFLKRLHKFFKSKNSSFFIAKNVSKSDYFLNSTHETDMFITRQRRLKKKKRFFKYKIKWKKKISGLIKSKKSKNSFYKLHAFRYLRENIKDNRMRWNEMFFGNRKITQKKLTKKIKLYSAKSKHMLFTMMELSLINVLLRSKFALSLLHAKELIITNFIYVNFKLQRDFYTSLQINSTVQLVLKKSYILYYLYTYNLNFKWLFKVGYCLWRYYRHRFSLYKQKPKSLPTWLRKIMHYKYNTPRHLEIDYTILTVIVIKQKLNWNKYNKKQLNSRFLRLLNWYWAV